MDNWGRRTLTPRGRRTGLFLMERRGQVRSTGEREAGPAAQHFITGSFICVCLRSAGQTELGVTGSESVRQWLAAALVSATHLRSPPKRTNGGQCGETHHTKPKTHTTQPTAHADGQTEHCAESNTGPSPYRPCPNSAPSESIRRTDTTASIPTGLMRPVAEIESGNGCKSGARSTMSPGPRDRRNGMGE